MFALTFNAYQEVATSIITVKSGVQAHFDYEEICAYIEALYDVTFAWAAPQECANGHILHVCANLVEENAKRYCAKMCDCDWSSQARMGWCASGYISGANGQNKIAHLYSLSPTLFVGQVHLCLPLHNTLFVQLVL